MIQSQFNNPMFGTKLGLTQVQGFTAPRELFVHGQKWVLIRDSQSHFMSVPPLNQMHWEFGNNLPLNFFDPVVYWYCLHGTKQPVNKGEKPVKLLFQWFHTIQLPLNPTQISEEDWQQANVYMCEQQGDFEMDFCTAMFGTLVQPQPNVPTGLIQTNIRSSNDRVSEESREEITASEQGSSGDSGEIHIQGS